ncbi:prolyl 3-hydroxylase 3-like [Haemaphysalis longicornis]
MESCRLQPNGSCAQPDHSSKLEHYGAVLFLNADFQGGHFVFVGKTASSIRASVRPKCGRAVIFAGDQPHGYLPLVGGRACRLVLGWRDAHGDAPRSASRTTRASRRRLGRSQGMRTKDLASRAFFVDRLRTSAPLTASTRILVVLAGMAPVALCYTCYFSYMFYFRYRWRR